MVFFLPKKPTGGLFRSSFQPSKHYHFAHFKDPQCHWIIKKVSNYQRALACPLMHELGVSHAGHRCSSDD